MRIAVVGTGNVGSVLGRRWSHAGHHVVFGSRRPGDPEVRELVEAAGPSASAATPREAVRDARVVLLAVPGQEAPEIAAGLGDLSGKILLDCTNPILPGLSGLSVGTDDSGAEAIARAVPDAQVVKGFSTTGTGNMEDPVYPQGRLAMFLCGDHAEAKTVVAELTRELDFEPVDCGPLSVARYLEPLAMLWITLAYPMGRGQDFGFVLAERA